MCAVQDSSLFALLALNATTVWIFSTLILFGEVVFFFFNYFIPTISSLYCLLSKVFGENMSPFCAVLCSFCLFFLRWSLLGEYILVFFFLFCYLCSLFLSFFFTFYVGFAFWSLSSCRWICLFILFVSCFLRVYCLTFLWIHMCRLQYPLRLHKNPGYSVMFKWRSRHLWIHVPPSHDWPQLCPARPPIPSFAFSGC